LPTFCLPPNPCSKFFPFFGFGPSVQWVPVGLPINGGWVRLAEGSRKKLGVFESFVSKTNPPRAWRQLEPKLCHIGPSCSGGILPFVWPSSSVQCGLSPLKAETGVRFPLGAPAISSAYLLSRAACPALLQLFSNGQFGKKSKKILCLLTQCAQSTFGSKPGETYKNARSLTSPGVRHLARGCQVRSPYVG
jgi:hypothetical protein